MTDSMPTYEYTVFIDAPSAAIHNWTWTFEPEDGGTRLNLVVIEQEPPWWQRVLDRAMEKGFSTQVRTGWPASRRVARSRPP